MTETCERCRRLDVADEPVIARTPAGWLESFDLEARDGRGMVRSACDPGRALVMTLADWLAAYRLSPACRPRRDDGEPNLPLVSYRTLTLEAAPEGAVPVPLAGTRMGERTDGR